MSKTKKLDILNFSSAIVTDIETMMMYWQKKQYAVILVDTNYLKNDINLPFKHKNHGQQNKQELPQYCSEFLKVYFLKG